MIKLMMRPHTRLVISLYFIIVPPFSHGSTTLTEARTKFYLSVEESQMIEPAINQFKMIMNDDSLKGVSLTYIGALTALKGKHAFMPYQKLQYVQKGLRIMDEGIAIDPDNLESRFIRGSTCYFLPFLFRRKEQAQNDFDFIITRLDEKAVLYNRDMMRNVIDFLFEYAELTPEEVQTLKTVKNKVK